MLCVGVHGNVGGVPALAGSSCVPCMCICGRRCVCARAMVGHGARLSSMHVCCECNQLSMEDC